LVDRDTFSVSLIDVMEELFIDGALPRGRVSLPLRLALVSCWMRTSRDDAERGHARFQVLSPEGVSLATGLEIEVDLESERRAQTIGKIEVMPLHGIGTYHFAVEFRGAQQADWQECARIPLEISDHPGEQQQSL
jgi:hypothetical protein